MPGIHPGFIQNAPVLTNSFSSDDLLQAYLRWRMPKELREELEPSLKRFGERCVSDISFWAERCEAQLPRLVPFDPWGKRIDEIVVSDSWLQLHKMAAEEGLIAIGYERKEGALSRMHQFAKLYMVHPSSAFYTCPLAMTDGAARVLELYGSPELKATAFERLTTRDGSKFWTSGQWMTEKTGGSDVSGTSTIAKKNHVGYQLFGEKWFTSATTSQMTMALAKVEGATDSREGLSLFYVEMRNAAGELNKIKVNRLKDKLGTKALPTAELILEGVPATLIGDVGEGVKRVAALLNITRLYNSICSLGTIARALNLAKDYAKKRTAFGKLLSEQPLYLQTLANTQAEFEAVFHLTFHLVHLLGKDETSEATNDESAILRLMTPVIKLWSAKQCLALVSESIESFGGAGYIEDTGLPRLLRDAQVFSIWEGTTNVLSLDALRAIAKEDALVPFFADFQTRLNSASSPELAAEVKTVGAALLDLRKYFQSLAVGNPEIQQSAARAFAFGLARTASACLMLEFADWCIKNRQRLHSVDVARRFCRKALIDLPRIEDCDPKSLSKIVYGA